MNTSSKRHRFIGNDKSLLMAGNCLISSAVITTVITILACYIYPEYFSITLQVLGHITMLIAVTGIKIGYLMRCVALHGMGGRQL